MALKTHECSVGSSFITLMVMQQIILLSVHLVFMTGQCTFAKPASNKTGVVRVNVTCRCVRVTLCRGQAINIKYSEYVSLALVAQHAKCMRLILSCGMCVSTIFFNIISYVTHSRKKKLLNIKYVFSFSMQHSPETYLIFRRIERDVHRSSCKVPVGF